MPEGGDASGGIKSLVETSFLWVTQMVSGAGQGAEVTRTPPRGFRPRPERPVSACSLNH